LSRGIKIKVMVLRPARLGPEPGLNSAEKAKRVTASRRIARVETD
jgi:hypothetical protein